MRVESNCLVPFCPYSEERLEGLPKSKDLFVQITQRRSNKQLNLWWAGLALAVHNFDDDMISKYPTSRHLSDAFLIHLGFKTAQYNIDGSISVNADSIAFENMEQEQYNLVFQRAELVAEKWLGYNPWEAWLKNKAGGG